MSKADSITRNVHHQSHHRYRGPTVRDARLRRVLRRIRRAVAHRPRQPPALVRGNVPGEWRYWGADAWSTRYSPLDQINASNFGSLKIAWQWNAGALRRGRVLPHDAALRERPPVHRRDDAPRSPSAIDPENGETLWMWRMDEGIRWQKAPRQFAGRGLAYWTDGTQRARHRRRRPATTWRRSTRRPACPIRSSARTASSTSWTVSDSRSCRSRWTITGPLIISDAAPARQGEAGRDVGREDEDRRRRHGRHRSRARPDRRQLARRSSSTTSSSSATRTSTATTRFALRNLPSYIRGFDVRTGKQLWKFNLVPQPGEFGAETWKNGIEARARRASARTMPGRPTRPIPSSGLVYIPVGMPLMDEYGGHRPGDNLYGNSLVALDVEDRASASGTSRWCITTSGTTTRRWRRTCST